MKTLKTFAILTLVATISLTTMTPAWAHHGHHGHHGHHHSDGAAIAGAAVGGTMLGLVLGSAMSQPSQPAQPQVVVVQPQTTDTGVTTKQHYMALELERERIRNIALEQELTRLRAVSNVK